MEKMAVIRPDITPDLNKESETKVAASDCVKSDIVDNCKAKAILLDADFRKEASAQVAKTLDSK